jgi:hypothetical protein
MRDGAGMKAYTIKPGNIAAYCTVIGPDGIEWDYCYLSECKQPEGTPRTERLMPFSELPHKVRAAVNRHFGTMFSLPIERREPYLKQCVPWEVTTEADNPCPFCGSLLGDDNSDPPRCLNCDAA